MNYIVNSPYGQQLLAQAAEAGQGLQTELSAREAGAGLGPTGGAESGANVFATSAGTQAQGNLERQTKAGIWQAALPIAAQQNAGYAQLALANQAEQNQEPSVFQKIAAGAGQLASAGGIFGKKIRKPGESAAERYM